MAAALPVQASRVGVISASPVGVWGRPSKADWYIGYTSGSYYLCGKGLANYEGTDLDTIFKLTRTSPLAVVGVGWDGYSIKRIFHGGKYNTRALRNPQLYASTPPGNTVNLLCQPVWMNDYFVSVGYFIGDLTYSVLISSDDGITWGKATLPLYSSADALGNLKARVFQDAEVSQRIFVRGDQTGSHGTRSYDVCYYSDDAVNWFVGHIAPVGLTVGELWTDGTDLFTYTQWDYATGMYRYKSTNGGATWGNATLCSANALWFVDGGSYSVAPHKVWHLHSGKLAATYLGAYLFRSTDNGVSWSTLSDIYRGVALVPWNLTGVQDMIYAWVPKSGGTPGKVILSTDDGDTFYDVDTWNTDAMTGVNICSQCTAP